jgi:hypothetical protein
MIRPRESKVQNTTLSALITVTVIQPLLTDLADLIVENPGIDVEAEMRQRIPDFDPYLEVPRVIVWHNAVARIPFPSNLFCGDYDSHYGIVRQENGAVEQNVTHEGSAVPERLKLSKPRILRS